jgi:hypothetical protein
MITGIHGFLDSSSRQETQRTTNQIPEHTTSILSHLVARDLMPIAITSEADFIFEEIAFAAWIHLCSVKVEQLRIQPCVTPG